MNHRQTVAAILRNDTLALASAYKQLHDAVNNIHTCPDCGFTGVMEDNGEHYASFHYSVLCPDCGYSHDPNA